MPVVRPMPIGHGDLAWVINNAADPEPDYVVTMSYASGAAPTLANMNALFTAFATGFDARIHNTYTLIRCHSLYQVDAEHQVALDSSESARAFTGVGLVLPPQVAALIRKRTAFAGRQFRGRIYVPGVLEGDVEASGDLSTAAHIAYEGAADLWFDGCANVVSPVLIHSCFHEPEDPVCVPPNPTPIVGVTADETVATQRRRLR